MIFGRLSHRSSQNKEKSAANMSKRPAYNAYSANDNAGSPGYSPAPETPISTTGYYSPLNPSHPLILPTAPARRKSKTTNTANPNPTKRRKSSHLLKDPHPHRDDEQLHQYEQSASPANQLIQPDKDELDLDNDQEEEDNRKELNDDDYTVRKREDLLNKDKLK